MSATLDDLNPTLQILAGAFVRRCKDEGLTVRITVTWRDSVDQDKAKTAGLSNASAGQSPHNCVDEYGNPASRAFDFALFDEGTYINDGTNIAYAVAGRIAEDLGLEWGGRWHHPDYDHVEMLNWRSVQPVVSSAASI